MPRIAALNSPILQGVQAYWPLSDLTDPLGGNTLTNVNGATFVPGKVGNAAQFVSASSQSLSIADNPALSVGGSAFTVAAWFWLDTAPAAEFGIVAKWGSAGSREFTLYKKTTNVLSFLIENATDTGTFAVDDTTVLAAGAWYFVVAWYDPVAAVVAIQVNNGTIFTTAATSGPPNSIGAFTIGRYGGGAFMNGKIDGVLFAKRVLDASERTAFYNFGLAGVEYPFGRTPSVNPLLTAMQAYWPLSSVADAHGANTLTNNNGATFVAGKVGNAVQLVAASSQYLSIADNAALSMGDIDFTIGAWVYLDTKTADGSIIGKWGGSQQEYLLSYINSTDRFRFAVSSTGSNTITLTANTFGSPSLATWYYVMAWHDSNLNTISIQINGGTTDSIGHALGVFNGTQGVNLGANAGVSSFVNGRIDSAFVSKRLYSAAERTALYNYGLQGVEYPFPGRLSVAQARVALASPRIGIDTYTAKVMDIDRASLIAYWRLNELSGTAADNIQGDPLRDGVYTNGPVLGQIGIGDGLTAPLLDGVDDNIDVYSASLAGAFNPLEGTLAIWGRMSSVGAWTDGTLKYLVRLRADGTNQISLYKTTVNSRLTFDYAAGGTSSTRNKDSNTTTDWFHMAITWSKSADQVIAYYNGVQEGAIITGLGTWVGALGSGTVRLGATAVAGSVWWAGFLAHAMLRNKALTAAQILALATVP